MDSLIVGLADMLRSDPFAEPPFPAIYSDIHKGLMVYESPDVSLAIGAINIAQLAAKKSAHRGATSIGFTGRMSVLKFVDAGDALLSFWEAPPIGAGFSATSAGRCVRTGERRLADGDVLVVDGRRQAYVIEQARANILLLQAEIARDQAPVGVEYDSGSLSYVGCNANDDGASRIQMMATLLRKLDCSAAFPVMAALLDHPDFFVRWHVMRELIGIDARAALPHLRTMAALDPHDDVRATAGATLAHLEQVVGDRKAA
ncbi:HEAT repeat domain-containing protein [Sphingosinicella sp. LHD-64]|uniref:HEAT repeat domain-containing protein n=1 Tax=Sphingosinicella sp. LHD-64 TaxID=3072139 RepID=UPI00280DD7B6|nr:HEAT repeat domain-containing protein [Sphingosinicella sp. LHD-64]MDQ8755235.1 HEAT repeat domain-containing protein [Sphingosinicella sp. LHD-64]